MLWSECEENWVYFLIGSKDYLQGMEHIISGEYANYFESMYGEHLYEE